MATERRQVFPMLEDALNNNEGSALSMKLEGAAAASGGVNYAGIMVGKDPSGNLQFIALNSNREVIVDADSAEVANLSGEGTQEDGSGTEVDIVTITLQTETVYRNIEWLVSCLRTAKYRVYWVADAGGTPIETDLAKGRVGAGAFDSHCEFETIEFTTGATGTQELRIAAYNTNVLSDIDAALGCVEEQ